MSKNIKKLKRDNYKVLLENPIKNKRDDIIGFDSEIERLKYSIREGANIVGIVSDFGAGKSTIIELLKNSLCKLKYKFVKINLWDNHLSVIDKNIHDNENTETTPNNESNIKLHKSFLRQLSMQTNKYRDDYINRRINSNYGIAKISFPTYRNLFLWILFYIGVIILTLFLGCKYYLQINPFNDITLSDKIEVLKYFFPKIPTISIVFMIIYIIFNKEVLFSFWNSSKNREITEEDTIQIYNELVKPIFPLFRLRKLIIVIEDLDRIKNPILVKYYINEFYRIYIEGNHKHKKGITFVFCVKDEFAYEELKDNQEIDKNDSHFIKIFDFSSNISNICINDFEEILKQLIMKDKLLSKIAIQEDQINIDEFLWIIQGENLNIRIIKKRLEYFKSLYLNIYNKGLYSNPNEKPFIDIKMCAFVSFLRSEYSHCIYKLLNTYDPEKQNYIDLKIIQKQTNKVAVLDEIDNKNNMKKYIIELINDDIITDDYKKYFYNFPKSTPIFTTSQNKVAKFIYEDNIPNDIKFDELDVLIDKSNNNNFILNQLRKRVSLGRGLPNLVFYNSTLFNICKNHYDEALDKLARNMFVLTEDNLVEVCKYIEKVKNSNINKNEFGIFIKRYIKETADIISDNEYDTNLLIEYRKAIIECLGIDAIELSDLFTENIIFEKEIEAINDMQVLLALVKPEELYTDSLKNAFIEKFNELLTEQNAATSLKEIIKTSNDLNLIFQIKNINYLNNHEKEEIYYSIISSHKTCDPSKKINILLHFELYDDQIINGIIDDINNQDGSDSLLVEYVNKFNKLPTNAYQYFMNSKTLYKLNPEIYENYRESNKTLYFGSKSLYEEKISNELLLEENIEYLSNLFLNYDELLSLIVSNENAIKLLYENKAFRKLRKTNGIEYKIIIFSRIEQSISLFKFVLNNKNISNDIKADYINKIQIITEETQKYILDYIQNLNDKPVVIIKSLFNRRQLFTVGLETSEKKSIAIKLRNKLNK